jgi:hypothetical protein
MTAKLPKPGTRRRALYDLLAASAGQWIDFDPRTLGYAGKRPVATEFREMYEMDIRCAGGGHNFCRWFYMPK